MNTQKVNEVALELNEVLMKIKNDEVNTINFFGSEYATIHLNDNQEYDSYFDDLAGKEIIDFCKENSISFDIDYCGNNDDQLCAIYNFKITQKEINNEK